MDIDYNANLPVLEFFVKWGGAVLLTGLVLSPFIVLKFVSKPLTWINIAGAYIASAVIFSILLYLILTYDRWLLDTVFVTRKINNSYNTALSFTWFWLFILWPLTPFYIAKIRDGRFTKKNILISFAWMIILFLLVFKLSIYAMGYGLGQLSNYL